MKKQFFVEVESNMCKSIYRAYQKIHTEERRDLQVETA